MEGLVSERRNDINVDTTSSTRNFGCVLIRSGVTYLPKCTIPATSRWDSRISGDGITRIFTLIISIRNFDGIYLASDRDARPRNSLTHTINRTERARIYLVLYFLLFPIPLSSRGIAI